MEGRDGKRFVGADQFSMDADDDVAFQFNDTATTLKGNKDTNSNETGMKSDGHDSETSRTRDLCYSFRTFALDCNNGRTDGREGGKWEGKRRAGDTREKGRLYQLCTHTGSVCLSCFSFLMCHNGAHL